MSVFVVHNKRANDAVIKEYANCILVMITHRQLFLNHVAQTSDAPLMLEIERAKGVYMYSPDGKRYLDLISGVSVSNVGHCHPHVVQAIRQQAERYAHLMVYGELVQSPQVALAHRLATLLPDSLNSVYFVSSGSEAVEGAMKLAKRHTHRPNVVSCFKAYHGSTQGSLSLYGGEELSSAYRPLLPGVSHIEFNNMDDLEKINETTACVVLEPVQGEAGVVSATQEYLSAVRHRCDQVGALLVFDEIQTGLGRTGRMFAFERYGIVPDILVLAKALGGGMPLGAFIAQQGVMCDLTHNPVLGHITTFGGHPISCAAGLAALDVLCSDHLVEQVERKAQIFIDGLKSHPCVKGIRHSGLLMAVELGNFDTLLKFIRYGVENGGYMSDWFLFCDTAFRISPPLSITDDECCLAIELIIKGLDSL